MASDRSTKAQSHGQARLEAIQLLTDRLQGKVRWHNIILFQRQDFSLGPHIPNEIDLARKAQLLHIVGASLGALLERRNCHSIDFLRSVIALFAEFDHCSGREMLPTPVHASQLVVRKEKGRRQYLSRAQTDYSLLALAHLSFTPCYYEAVLGMLEMLEELHARVDHELSRLRAMATENGMNPAAYDESPAARELLDKLDSKIRKVLVHLQRDLEAIARAKLYRELDGMMDALALLD